MNTVLNRHGVTRVCQIARCCARQLVNKSDGIELGVPVLMG
jgi:hypothetical protein